MGLRETCHVDILVSSVRIIGMMEQQAEIGKAR